VMTSRLVTRHVARELSAAEFVSGALPPDKLSATMRRGPVARYVAGRSGVLAAVGQLPGNDRDCRRYMCGTLECFRTCRAVL
jgi:hypothetical protein